MDVTPTGIFKDEAMMQADSPQIKPVPYSAVRSRLHVGDILLARPSSLMGRMITHVTSEDYSHASMLGLASERPHEVLMIGETREHKDARLIAMSHEIQRWPGYYDVFRAKRLDWSTMEAWAFVCRAAGTSYGWRHISRVWLRRRIGTWIPPIRNSDDPEWPRDCSALVHAALRAGGGPQVREHDSDVVPGDLCDPRHFEYQCTLVWSWDQINSF